MMPRAVFRTDTLRFEPHKGSKKEVNVNEIDELKTIYRKGRLHKRCYFDEGSHAAQ